MAEPIPGPLDAVPGWLAGWLADMVMGGAYTDTGSPPRGGAEILQWVWVWWVAEDAGLDLGEGASGAGVRERKGKGRKREGKEGR